MGRPKELEGGYERISVTLSKAQAEHLRKEALRLSVKEGRTIALSEMVRLSVDKAFPIGKKST